MKRKESGDRTQVRGDVKHLNHHALSPAIRIGKLGVTDNVIRQIKQLLKRNKAIKVKFLASAVGEDKRAQAEKLAIATNTTIVHRVGFVVVLARKV